MESRPVDRARALIDSETHRGHGPQADLQPEHTDNDDLDHALQARRGKSVRGGQEKSHHKEKNTVGACDEQRGQLNRAVELQPVVRCPSAATRGDEALDDGQHRERHEKSDDGKPPVHDWVAQEFELHDVLPAEHRICHALRATFLPVAEAATAKHSGARRAGGEQDTVYYA